MLRRDNSEQQNFSETNFENLVAFRQPDTARGLPWRGGLDPPDIDGLVRLKPQPLLARGRLRSIDGEARRNEPSQQSTETR
jgi:hypothetical protein